MPFIDEDGVEHPDYTEIDFPSDKLTLKKIRLVFGDLHEAVSAVREMTADEAAVARYAYWTGRYGADTDVETYGARRRNVTPAELLAETIEELREGYRACGLYHGETTFREQVESIKQQALRQVKGRDRD
jgi:hypothetical protein